MVKLTTLVGVSQIIFYQSNMLTDGTLPHELDYALFKTLNKTLIKTFTVKFD